MTITTPNKTSNKKVNLFGDYNDSQQTRKTMGVSNTHSEKTLIRSPQTTQNVKASTIKSSTKTGLKTTTTPKQVSTT
jgi:hypothetical protein